MLRQRLRSRTAILAEIDRVEGPEIAARDGMTVGPVVQMGTFMPHSVEAEAELCSWYVWHRLPLIREMPGCIGARRLVSVVGRYKQSILYDFTRVNDLDGHFSDPHPDSRRMLAQISHAPNSPTLGTRVWPPVSAS